MGETKFVMCVHCGKRTPQFPGGGKRKNYDSVIERLEKKIPDEFVIYYDKIKLVLPPQYAKSVMADILRLAIKYPKLASKSVEIWIDNVVYVERGLSYLRGIIKRSVDEYYRLHRPC